MAAAVLMRRRLGSSLVDASARLGLGGSVGALVTRRSAVVLHPSAASVTEVAAARPGLGGSVGAFMAKQARVAAASYLNTGSRGIAAASYSTTGARGLAGVGSWASGLRSVGSGASGFRSVMLLPIRSFSKRPEKGSGYKVFVQRLCKRVKVFLDSMWDEVTWTICVAKNFVIICKVLAQNDILRLWDGLCSLLQGCHGKIYQSINQYI